MTAGATTIRTISTSIMIAAPSPMPKIFTITSGSVAKPRKTAVMIVPAARMILLTRASPRRTLSRGFAPFMYSSRIRDWRKTL
jgi:hypothetical protein